MNSDIDYSCDEATIDPVTNLFNRKTFMKIAEQCLKQIENDSSKVVPVPINSDDFYNITSKYSIEFHTVLL